MIFNPIIPIWLMIIISIIFIIIIIKNKTANSISPDVIQHLNGVFAWNPPA